MKNSSYGKMNWKKGTLTLERRGRFMLRTNGDFHCGIPSPCFVDYKFTAICATSLGYRGFLFDQLTVDKFFQDQKDTMLSCEKFSIKCLKDLIKHLKKENAKCKILTAVLTLSPEPFLASITYTLST